MITLPEELVLLIAAGVGFLVTNGLKALLPNIDISGTAAKITAALVTSVVALSNQGLALIPAQYQPIAVTLFSLVIAVLGAYGIHYSLKSRTPEVQADQIPPMDNTPISKG